MAAGGSVVEKGTLSPTGNLFKMHITQRCLQSEKTNNDQTKLDNKIYSMEKLRLWYVMAPGTGWLFVQGKGTIFVKAQSHVMTDKDLFI